VRRYRHLSLTQLHFKGAVRVLLRLTQGVCDCGVARYNLGALFRNSH